MMKRIKLDHILAIVAIAATAYTAYHKLYRDIKGIVPVKVATVNRRSRRSWPFFVRVLLTELVVAACVVDLALLRVL